jgi:Ni,Fe-hydrogenase I cytochrome b subunit
MMSLALKLAAWFGALAVALLTVVAYVRSDLEPGMGLMTDVNPWISVPAGMAGSTGFVLLTASRKRILAASLALVGTAYLALSLHVLYWNPVAGEIKEYWGLTVISKEPATGVDDTPFCSETSMFFVIFRRQGRADISYFRGVWPARFSENRLPFDPCNTTTGAS